MDTTTIGLKYGIPSKNGEFAARIAYMLQTGEDHPAGAPGQLATADPDAATGDVARSHRPDVDDAKASHARSRVETQDTHRRQVAVALQWQSA